MTPAKKIIAACYSRISTSDKGQCTDLQKSAMEEYCQRKGWGCVHYSDEGWSGKKAKRPELSRMMKDVRDRKYGAVVCWKIDRLGRSLSDLLITLNALKELDVAFVATSSDIDTTTASGKLMFSMVGAFAEFESSLISERVRAGMAAAKVKNIMPGPKRTELDMAAIRTRRTAGESLRHIARELGVSPALLVKRFKAGDAVDTSAAGN